MKLRTADCGLQIEGPRPGLPVLAAAALILALALSACSRRTARPVAPSPASAALLRYESAEKSFGAGDYAAAARAYQTYLQAGVPDNRDRALFRAGIAYALAGDAGDNAAQSRAMFQQLATQFPGSTYTAPANLILRLETQIDKLSDDLNDQQAKVKLLAEELRRLKDIDLHRKPTRPPQ